MDDNEDPVQHHDFGDIPGHESYNQLEGSSSSLCSISRDGGPGRVRAVAEVRPLSMEDVMMHVTHDPGSADRYLSNLEEQWIMPQVQGGTLSGQQPRPRVTVHSERPGGTSERRAKLKRRAEHISRSACESFSYLTSTNASDATASKFLSTFGNVSHHDIHIEHNGHFDH